MEGDQTNDGVISSDTPSVKVAVLGDDVCSLSVFGVEYAVAEDGTCMVPAGAAQHAISMGHAAAVTEDVAAPKTKSRK
jgi:hypothetical protein